MSYLREKKGPRSPFISLMRSLVLQYLDKIAISYASVTGIKESAHLQGNEFNWIASIFFFGQLVFEFPTIRLIQLFPLAKYVAVNVII